MSVGKELLDVPFDELIHSMAVAIAEGQLALDRSSIQTLLALSKETTDVITSITEIIEPDERTIAVKSGSTIPYSGAKTRAGEVQTVPMTLLQAGLTPSFYQFTEATMEVKLSITLKETAQPASSSSAATKPAKRPFKAHAAPVNFRNAATYSYEAQGATVLRATIRPTPPPPRLVPTTIAVNALTTPPTVSISNQ
jgi:hypothetical protein